MVIRVPAADLSTLRSKGPDGVEVGRLYEYFVVCKGLRPKSRDMEVIEDYDSRQHKPVSVDVRCRKASQEVMVLKARNLCLESAEQKCRLQRTLGGWNL